MKKRSWLIASLAAVAILLCSCGTAATHPGSINKTDSQIYDTLISAQAAIEQAKAVVDPTSTAEKLAVNKAIAAYNLAMDSYIAYHKAAAAGVPPDPGDLLAQVQTLVADVAALRGKP